ncbi:MAG: hypothetical protein FJX78_08625, partial [Armatimonadetes bacterium]|nr:hypothetical protein [Armatimonadota bacterium]
MRMEARAAAVLAALLIASAGSAPARAQTPPAPPLEILAAAVAEYDAQTETWVATGSPVRARRDGTEVSAARIRYSTRDRVATAEGDARVSRAGQRVRADRLRADLRSQDVVADGAVVLEYDAADGTVTLRAPRVSGNLGTRRYAATGGVDVAQPA